MGSDSFGIRLKLDGPTLLKQIRLLGEIGADERGGRTRLVLTDADRAGRDVLISWMHDLGLDVAVDRIGNIFGTLRSPNDQGDEQPLMLGSHIDTVKYAGALDGAYGVLAGLAVVRAFRAAGELPARSITVAAFTNEEGVRYQPDMLGSLVSSGGYSLADALNIIGIDGTRLGDELERIGYAGTMDAGSLVPHAYLELHIEQGPILETEQTRIGVVENLQGISWQRLTIQGVANHAGTTPLALRHDAGLAAAQIVVALRDLARRSARTLATVGSLRLEPDAINIIPNKVVMTVDLRDPDETRLQQAEQQLVAILAEVAEREGVAITSERLARFTPVVFDAGLVDAIEAAATRLGLSSRRMTSGAGHDAQMIARVAPAAMIFVPSRGGISHSPDEHTDDEDLICGAEVLLAVVEFLLAAQPRQA